LFSNLFFLILVLILLTLAPEVDESYFELGVYNNFYSTIGIYIAILFCQIAFGTLGRTDRFRNSRFPFFLANSSLLLFLVVYHFAFASHLVYRTLAIVSSSQSFLVFISLLFYFTGMWVYYYFSFSPITLEYQVQPKSRKEKAFSKLRFLLPFVLPFLFFSFFFDTLSTLPFFSSANEMNGGESVQAMVFMTMLTLALLFATLVFFPFFLQYIWGCEPMEEGDLKDRLNRLCEKAEFKHAGLMNWTVMNSSLTAAIVGVYSRFRYVMFTKRLLNELTPDEVEAVLAHEMGHSFFKHMIFYPWVILGMLVVQGMFSSIFGEGINHVMSLLILGDPSGFWEMIYPLLVFVIYSAILLIYFRIVYGFVSRNFERQADLFVFSVGIPGENMISALNSVATLCGNVHEKPSWHHFSIRERMNFLKEAVDDFSIVEKHHFRVTLIKSFFPVILLLCTIMVFSSSFKDYPLTSSVYSVIYQSSESIKEYVAVPFRKSLAEKFLEDYNLKGDQEAIILALQEGFKHFGADKVSGVAEFYGAQILYAKGEIQPSVDLMTIAWKRFNFSDADKSTIQDFALATRRIVEVGMENANEISGIEPLLDEMHKVLKQAYSSSKPKIK
jgi:Zn-dependent protease with chaperone function